MEPCLAQRMAKSNARIRSTARTRTGEPSGPRRGGPSDPRKPEAAASKVAPRKKPAARKAAKLPKPISGAVRVALDKKAEDVVVLDLRKASGFTDYFVICTGANPRQITAIADSVRETLKRDFDERATLAEGVDRSEWILLDYFDFVVHIFSRDCRAFYGLERLWGNAERIEFRDETTPGAAASS
jgi:ribosome-associated protein